MYRLSHRVRAEIENEQNEQRVVNVNEKVARVAVYKLPNDL